jgi:Phosphatidylinositol N-acetylglucosaminyltransferase
MSVLNAEQERWERVLYKRQDYPDNYVPQDFLHNLVANGKQTA